MTSLFKYKQMQKIIYTLILIIFVFTVKSQTVSEISNHPDFNASLKPFYHGVASGDAKSDKIILWTKITSDINLDSVIVKWYISEDNNFNIIQNSGVFVTNASVNYTVKIDADKLKANTKYFYYFEALCAKSLIGKTQTIPKENFLDGEVKFAVFSGSNYNAGYFNAYRSVAENPEIDAVLHLGDYIYEYKTDVYGKHKNRWLYPDKELISLDDYRKRYSHYRLDSDLMEAHKNLSWYVIWDDHETANNSWREGAENHNIKDGDWKQRMSAGKKAFLEWLPVRENEKQDVIYRNFKYGKLFNLIFLDTRLIGRDAPKGLSNMDTNKTMLGNNQYKWLENQLYNSQNIDTVVWKIVAQQVMFAPLIIGKKVINPDQWDGYQYERQKILEYVSYNKIDNTIVLTGDIHTSWANELYLDKKKYKKNNAEGSIFVEFVTPSVTSSSLNKTEAFFANPFVNMLFIHIKYVELSQKGYILLTVNRDNIISDWYFVSTIKNRDFTLKQASSWYVKNGETILRKNLK